MLVDFTEDEKKNLGLTTLSVDSNPRQSKKKCERITFTLNNPVQIDYAIHVMETEFNDGSSRNKYLYILHDKDEGEDGLIKTHLHAIVWGNARRFIDWANQLSIPDDKDNAIPPHMICFCRNPRSMARYLIHKDTKDKFQYSKDEVKGSREGLQFFEKALIDYQDVDLDSELKDFARLRFGVLSPNEYLSKYRTFYSSDKFANRIRLYTSVYENYNVEGFKK